MAVKHSYSAWDYMLWRDRVRKIFRFYPFTRVAKPAYFGDYFFFRTCNWRAKRKRKRKKKRKKEITDTCGRDLWQPINNIYRSIQIAVAILLQGEQTYWKLGAFLLRRTRTKYWSSASASRGNFPYVTSRTCQIQDLAQLSFFCRYRFLHCSYRNVTRNM